MYPNLKLHIWQSGIHQNELAREIGIDESLLSRIINGYREPTADVRNRIARFLCVDEKWLFTTSRSSTVRRTLE